MSSPEERAYARLQQKAADQQVQQQRERQNKAYAILAAWRQYFAEQKALDYPDSYPLLGCVVPDKIDWKGRNKLHQHQFTVRRIMIRVNTTYNDRGDTYDYCVLPEEVVVSAWKGQDCLTHARSLEDYFLQAYRPEFPPGYTARQ